METSLLLFAEEQTSIRSSSHAVPRIPDQGGTAVRSEVQHLTRRSGAGGDCDNYSKKKMMDWVRFGCKSLITSHSNHSNGTWGIHGGKVGLKKISHEEETWMLGDRAGSNTDPRSPGCCHHRKDLTESGKVTSIQAWIGGVWRGGPSERCRIQSGFHCRTRIVVNRIIEAEDGILSLISSALME